MVALASLLIFVALTLLINHIATVALSLTGLSREVARFQARSAFTGVGFTTNEAEKEGLLREQDEREQTENIEKERIS